MKQRFTIQYNTVWGESMHVALSYLRADGSRKKQNVLMNTSDGQWWTAETVARASGAGFGRGTGRDIGCKKPAGRSCYLPKTTQ